MFLGRDPKCCEELNLGGSLEIEPETLPMKKERSCHTTYSTSILNVIPPDAPTTTTTIETSTVTVTPASMIIMGLDLKY